MAPRSAFPRWIPLALGAGALLTLLAATLWVNLRGSHAREVVVQVILPASRNLADVQFKLSREMALLRGFLLTGDARMLARYDSLHLREVAVWESIRPLAAHIGAGFADELAELERNVDEWRRMLGVDALRDAGNPAAFQDRPAPFHLQDDRFEALLVQAARLEDQLRAAADEQIAALEAFDRLRFLLTLIGVIVALGAVGSAVWLAGRNQALAVEADRRRLEADRLSHARTTLIRGLSHDLKNPIAAATGYIDLIELRGSERLTPQQRDWLDRVRAGLRAAVAILDDLVQLSRVETGTIAIEPEPIRPADAAANAFARQEGEFHRAGVFLDIHIDPAVESTMVRTDPRRVEQILENLLSNAAKYAPRGARAWLQVSMTAQSPPAPAPGTWAAFHVVDEGPGIPPDMQERIFEEFVRLRPDTASGLGLGLPISRRLARLLGGDLTVRSEPGKGATFTLWLPANLGH